jgi:putative membrane protein
MEKYTKSKLGRINWKLVLMRILVNGLAIALTVFFLPGLRVVDLHVGTFLLMGAAYGLLNAFVKPIIQFLTLSFLFVTYGLVIVLINSIMLVLLGFLFPSLELTSGLPGLVIGSTLLAFFALLLESIFGLTPPLIDDAPATASLECHSEPGSVPPTS